MSLDLLEAALMQEDVTPINEMLELIENAKAAGETIRQPLDQLTIRKMIIKMKMLQKEVEQQKAMQKAIFDAWQSKIDKITHQIDDLEEVVYAWLTEQNKGKTLSLDVANVSLRKVKSNVEVLDKKAFEQFMKDAGKYEDFLKSPELDVTKAKNDVLSYVESKIKTEPAVVDELPACLNYKPEHQTLVIKFT